MSSTITNKQGVMKRTCRVEVNIPPMLGAAIGFMMSMPGRVEKTIGTSENTTAATVINFGRRRHVEPRITASM